MSDPASIILAIATLIGVLGNTWVQVRNNRKTDDKIDALHQSTNSLSERNEKIAKKLGIEEGKQIAQQEREDNTP